MNINEVMDSLEEFRESGNCDFTLVKIDESYEYNEDGVKVLTKTKETYEVPTEADVNAMIDYAKNSRDWNLVGHTTKFHPDKYKKEVLVKPEYYVLTLKREF